MRKAIKPLLAVLILALVGGLLVVAVIKVRETAKRISCRNNLRQLGLALPQGPRHALSCLAIAPARQHPGDFAARGIAYGHHVDAA